MTSAQKICAGIVAYYPIPIDLLALINSLSTQVDTVVVFNNGGLDCKILGHLENVSNIILIGDGNNFGIGRALNEIANLARSLSMDFLVTFDQDSAPGINMVTLLKKQWELLVCNGLMVGAIGPVIVDHRNRSSSFPIFQPGRFWIKKKRLKFDQKTPIPTSMIITSGMFFSLESFGKIGPFKESYFIDYVDTEWCLRSLEKHFFLFICPEIVMVHALSDDAPKRFLGRLVLRYSLQRRYYQIRNGILLIHEKHAPFYIKIYVALTIIYRLPVYFIIDNQKFKLIKTIMRALSDGLKGSDGKCEFDWL